LQRTELSWHPHFDAADDERADARGGRVSTGLAGPEIPMGSTPTRWTAGGRIPRMAAVLLPGAAMGAMVGAVAGLAGAAIWLAALLGAAVASAATLGLERRRRRAHAAELEDRLEQMRDQLAAMGAHLARQRDEDAEQLRAEAKHHQSRKLEALGQLAGGVAHDFNNLLTAIQGNAELIRLYGGDDVAEEVDEILTAARRGSHMVSKLLFFARRGTAQRVVLELHDVIEEAAQLLRHGLDRTIQVNRDLRAELSTVRGDPTLIQNALLNLGVNARDAMPEGGDLTFGTRSVTFGAPTPWHDHEVPAGDWIELTVSDTGGGIPDDVRERLFEPFFTTKAPGRGTGLGLASVYGTVVDHQGFIAVAPGASRGTTFAILLPCVRGEAEAPSRVAVEPPRPRAGHVLLVDDEEPVRKVAEKMLTELGCSISSCADGLEAVQLCYDPHDPIDLVILDMNMPRLDGRRTFQELRRFDPDLRVILTSGHGVSPDVERCLEEGALGFIQKPFLMEDLSQAVARYGKLQRRPTLPS